MDFKMYYKDNEFLWEQKYRPNSIKECILPKSIKNIFELLVEKEESKNLLLYGSGGIGKTSIAYAFCNDLQADIKYVNASLDTSIEVLRNEIYSFATSMSLFEKKKVVIFDEYERMSQNSIDASRGLIEAVSSNCRFIATTNYLHKLPEPIISRFDVIEFKIEKSERPELMMQTFKRCLKILENENVTYDKNVIQELVKLYYPDIRKLLQQLQKAALSGNINESCLISKKDLLNELVGYIKTKDFGACKKWNELNFDYSDNFYRQFYDVIYPQLKSESIPGTILNIADYQYKSQFGGDKSIYLDALCLQLIIEATFK